MEEIINIAKKAQAEGFVTEKGCFISIRDTHGMIITENDADFSNLDMGNLVAVSRNANMNKEFATHMAIYQGLPSVKVIVHLKPKYCNIASKINITPRASCELFSEAIGKKLNISTSIPERLVETLLKDKECLVLNGGLIVAGQTLESTYNRAKIIEQAVFTYIAVKAIDKRTSARAVPCDKLYDKCAAKDYDFSNNLCGIRLGLDKLKESLLRLDEENTCVLAVMPIFIGLFANSTLNIDGITTIEYGELDNKKYLKNVSETANREGLVLLRSRGLLVVDDDSKHAQEKLNKVEIVCKEKIINLLQHALDDYTVGLESLPKLFAKRLNLKAVPVLQ